MSRRQAKHEYRLVLPFKDNQQVYPIYLHVKMFGVLVQTSSQQKV